MHLRVRTHPLLKTFPMWGMTDGGPPGRRLRFVSRSVTVKGRVPVSSKATQKGTAYRRTAEFRAMLLWGKPQRGTEGLGSL